MDWTLEKRVDEIDGEITYWLMCPADEPIDSHSVGEIKKLRGEWQFFPHRGTCFDYCSMIRIAEIIREI